MTEHFYKHQIHVDEYEERFNSNTNELGRIVSKEGIYIYAQEVEEVEEEYDEAGRLKVSKKFRSFMV